MSTAVARGVGLTLLVALAVGIADAMARQVPPSNIAGGLILLTVAAVGITVGAHRTTNQRRHR